MSDRMSDEEFERLFTGHWATGDTPTGRLLAECRRARDEEARLEQLSFDRYRLLNRSAAAFVPHEDRVSDGVRRLKESVEAQCRALGEERIREMVAEGWTLCEWITTEGYTVTLHAQLMPPTPVPHESRTIPARTSEMSPNEPLLSDDIPKRYGGKW